MSETAARLRRWAKRNYNPAERVDPSLAPAIAAACYSHLRAAIEDGKVDPAKHPNVVTYQHPDGSEETWLVPANSTYDHIAWAYRDLANAYVNGGNTNLVRLITKMEVHLNRRMMFDTSCVRVPAECYEYLRSTEGGEA
jgi:hypothetical protein